MVATPDLTELFREGARFLQTAPVRAVYRWFFVIPAVLFLAVVVTKVFPAADGVVSVVVAVVIGGFALFALGGVLVLSIRRTYPRGWIHAAPYVLFAAAVPLGVAGQLVPRWLSPVIETLAGAAMMLSVPATFLSILLSSRPVPTKLDLTTLRTLGPDLRAAWASMMESPSVFAPAPAAPFGEAPAAMTGRLEQLHAMNAMLRAARANMSALTACSRIMLAGFPVLMLLCAALGLWTSINGIVTGRLPPRSSIADGFIVAGVCAGLAAVVYTRVIAPHRQLGRLVQGLAKHVGGQVFVDHATLMLDWLDRHWADTAPSHGPAMFGWHWVVPFELHGRPVLLSVLDDPGGRGAPRMRRIDLYVPHAGTAPLLEEAAVARVRTLGFEAVQGAAGLRIERLDNDRAALAPQVLDGLTAIVRGALG